MDQDSLIGALRVATVTKGFSEMAPPRPRWWGLIGRGLLAGIILAVAAIIGAGMWALNRMCPGWSDDL